MNAGMITTAASQYANRPADESYPDLASMIAAAEYERTHSKEVGYNLRDLKAYPGFGGIFLESPKGNATVSCRQVRPEDCRMMILSWHYHSQRRSTRGGWTLL